MSDSYDYDENHHTSYSPIHALNNAPDNNSSANVNSSSGDYDSSAPTYNLFVGDLHKSASEQQLRDAFSKYGAIHSVSILKDKGSGQPRGCGFVNFFSESALDEAITHDIYVLDKLTKNSKSEKRDTILINHIDLTKYNERNNNLLELKGKLDVITGVVMKNISIKENISIVAQYANYGASVKAYQTLKDYLFENNRLRVYPATDKRFEEQVTLFVRNVHPNTTEKTLQTALEKFGKINKLNIVRDHETGECFQPGTQLLLYNGTMKKVEDFIGDEILMGDDNQPRIVIKDSIHKGYGLLYRIIPESTGIDEQVVNGKHTLVLKITEKPFISYNSQYNQWQCNWFTINHNNMLILESQSFHTESQAAKALEIHNNTPFLWETKVENYLNCQLKHYCHLYSPDLVLFNAHTNKNNNNTTTNNTFINSESARLLGFWLSDSVTKSYPQINSFLTQLNLNEHNKHFPLHLLTESPSIRKSLLAGYIENSASYHNLSNQYEILNSNPGLMDGAIFLARSLGYRVSGISQLQFTLSGNKLSELNDYIIDTSKHFKSIQQSTVVEDTCYKFSVEPLTNNSSNTEIPLSNMDHISGDYYGFSVSGINERFLMKDFTVTHNSKQYAFVTMETQAECVALIRAADGLMVDGNAVGLKFADKALNRTILPPTSSYSRERGRGGGGPARGGYSDRGGGGRGRPDGDRERNYRDHRGGDYDDNRNNGRDRDRDRDRDHRGRGGYDSRYDGSRDDYYGRGGYNNQYYDDYYRQPPYSDPYYPPPSSSSSGYPSHVNPYYPPPTSSSSSTHPPALSSSSSNTAYGSHYDPYNYYASYYPNDPHYGSHYGSHNEAYPSSSSTHPPTSSDSKVYESTHNRDNPPPARNDRYERDHPKRSSRSLSPRRHSSHNDVKETNPNTNGDYARNQSPELAERGRARR